MYKKKECHLIIKQLNSKKIVKTPFFLVEMTLNTLANCIKIYSKTLKIKFFFNIYFTGAWFFVHSVRQFF